MASAPDTEGIRPSGKRRVSSVVGLSLLEVIRALDLPGEILASEDPTQTIPRRLGLSDVVEQQIRLYRDQVRRKEKITDQQAQDLVHLVLRRPDSEEAFFQAGDLLAARERFIDGNRQDIPVPSPNRTGRPINNRKQPGKLVF